MGKLQTHSWTPQTRAKRSALSQQGSQIKFLFIDMLIASKAQINATNSQYRKKTIYIYDNTVINVT